MGCRPEVLRAVLQAVLQAVLGLAVLEGVKQLDPKNSSAVSVCIHVGSSCFASCFELFWRAVLCAPHPIGGTTQNTLGPVGRVI